MTVNSQSGPRSPRPPDDLISTATSALRRLHFKTGRNATKNSSKQAQSVPKVIVMGSSTASETTINTSTDSSNTIVTTVTATDGDVTEDSLDITEPMDYFNSDNVTDGNKILQPVPVSPKTPSTARQQTPATAKLDSKFNFEVETPKAVLSKDENRFVFDSNEVGCIPEEKSVEKLMEEQIEALKMEARRRNSYKAAAQNDFVRMSVDRTSPKEFRRGYKATTQNDMEKMMVDKTSPKEHRRSVRKRLDVEGKEKPERTSPKRRAERNLNSSPETNEDSPKPKHRHKKTSRRHHSPNKQREKFTYDEKHIAKYREKARMTPPLPDLRVDFFNETVDGCQIDSLHVSGEKRGSVCLNKCLREVGAQLEASATSPINVTTNPLENSVHFGGRKAPQATIVVQQPSLSLDHSNVSTILLKNGSEFVSNVESVGNKLSFKRQKEENMKQLLDVANNLTLEEIHDFEMR
ncbi:uncharacterized protein BDFB_011396 [Asbolus verrucosus]|uniref:Uncharacterized protein n=1 Tax=Asbolus verrucosus TaxID=1661398 RepID=A0A482W9L3_ASBVE|nr:uncharacterized protein BDFB_011396 [Asbolus verrucosus]